MQEIKYTRFEYLSNYYKDLLIARLQLNNENWTKEKRAYLYNFAKDYVEKRPID